MIDNYFLFKKEHTCARVCVIDLLSGGAGGGWVSDQPADSEVRDLTSLLFDREDFLSAGCLPGAS